MELEPCPFCGGKAKMQFDEGIYYAMCERCMARSHGARSYSVIVRRWNRRHLTPRAADAASLSSAETPGDNSRRG